MPRARSLKPGFFKNEILASLGYEAMLLFEGLWILADREGRLEDRPLRIKAEIFPYTSPDVDKLLGTLQDAGFVIRYSVNQINYIAIPTWHKHQSPHVKEQASTIPAPGENYSSMVPAPDRTECRIPSSLTPSSLTADSGNPVQAPGKHHARTESAPLPQEESPRPYFEEIADELSRMRAKAKRGHSISIEDREVLLTWLRNECPDCPAEAFSRFLHDEYWREKKPAYPIQGFIRKYSQYAVLPSTPTNGNSAAPRPEPAVEAVAPEAIPIGVGQPAPPPALPVACEEWNRVVTAGEPVEGWTKRDANLLAAMNDPDFLEALPRILDRCQRAHQAQGDEASWLTFRWLLKRKTPDAPENWYRIVNGDMAWATAKKGARGKRKSAGQLATEEFEASLGGAVSS